MSEKKLETQPVIEIDIDTLVSSVPSFNELIAMDGIKAKTSFKISRIVKQAQTALKDFNEARNQLCLKHNGVVDAATNTYTFENKEDQNKVDVEFQELKLAKIQLIGRTIKLIELGELKVPPTIFVDLDWLFEE